MALIEDTTVALILARFDTQDKVLDRLLREARITNGRVTKLETQAAVSVGVADVDRERHEQANVRASLKYQRLDAWVPVLCVLGGGVVGDVGHHFGLW